MAVGKEADFSRVKSDEAEKLLMTNLGVGLTAAEVESRRREYWFNEIAEKESAFCLGWRNSSGD